MLQSWLLDENTPNGLKQIYKWQFKRSTNNILQSVINNTIS